MKLVGGVVGGGLRTLGLLPKKPPKPQAVAAVTTDDARDSADREALLRSRRGSRDDMVTGAGGAEAGRGGAVRLG